MTYVVGEMAAVMLEAVVGADEFALATKNFLEQFADKGATYKDFVREVQKVGQ